MRQEWWKEAVIYQIYPRSFKDSNGDGIGDIPGIIGKLDYLKDLGVDVIWLSPVYRSPNADNGYDISDYQDIMDEFGTMEDMDELIRQIHKRGLKLMMDMVVNHTSDEHEWFQNSCQSADNPYADYYIWKKGKNGGPPNNWGSFFGGSAWEYCESRDAYYLHMFAKKQPDLNWENPKVRRDVKRMMCWWLEKGVDGFRLDVINLLAKDQSFPDGEKDMGEPYGNMIPYTHNVPKIHSFLKELNRDVFEKYSIVTVGETLETTVEDGKKYAGFEEHELNMIFTFEHMNVDNGLNSKWSDQKFRLTKLKEIMNRWQTELQGVAWNSLYWNNHDQPRVVSRFGNDGVYWERSAKMLGTCLHMMQGTPYIYQGEEIGMTNCYFDCIEDYEDVESVTAFRQHTELMGQDPDDMMRYIRWKSRDNARTAMQWDDSEFAGFGTNGAWFAVNPNYKKINVESQLKDQKSILNYYKKLIRLRKQYPVVVYGDYIPLLADNEENFCYIRRYEKEELLVLCSFTEKKQEIQLPEQYQGRQGQILISNLCVISDTDEKNAVLCQEGKSILLEPYEARVILFR
ncbi:MAG: alpha-glucosidase [Acetatifactor sp.]